MHIPRTLRCFIGVLRGSALNLFRTVELQEIIGNPARERLISRCPASAGSTEGGADEQSHIRAEAADSRPLHDHRGAAQQDHLVAPVELVSFAWGKAQRDISGRGRCPPTRWIRRRRLTK